MTHQAVSTRASNVVSSQRRTAVSRSKRVVTPPDPSGRGLRSQAVSGGITISAADGVTLEAELALPDAPARAGAVLCHPHPQFGGTMRSIVIGALFRALPAAGVVCLRF